VAFTQLVLLVMPALPNLAINTNKGVSFFGTPTRAKLWRRRCW